VPGTLGHISALFVPGLTDRVLRWLAPRLEMVKKATTERNAEQTTELTAGVAAPFRQIVWRGDVLFDRLTYIATQCICAACSKKNSWLRQPNR
jgi:hypothetical protein